MTDQSQSAKFIKQLRELIDKADKYGVHATVLLHLGQEQDTQLVTIESLYMRGSSAFTHACTVLHHHLKMIQAAEVVALGSPLPSSICQQT